MKVLMFAASVVLVVVIWLTMVVSAGSGLTGALAETSIPPKHPELALAPRDLRDVWRVQTVDSVGNVGGRPALAVGPGSGSLHVSYFDITNLSLKYASSTDNGLTWKKQTIDSPVSGGYAGLWNSLAVNAGGDPRIAYTYDVSQSTSGSSLRYAARTSDTWSIQTVDDKPADYSIGFFPSLALNSIGQARVAYGDVSAGTVKYARQTGLGWSLEDVSTWQNNLQQVSLQLDPTGNAAIAYSVVYSECGSYLRFARWTGSNWNVETISDAGIEVSGVSLAMDRDNRPHIAYFDACGYYDLKHAYRMEGGSWNVETVDSAGDVGEHPSVAFDATGNACIAYYKRPTAVADGELRYGCRRGDGWATEIVAGLGKSTTWDKASTSLSFDGAGNPHIVYYHPTNGDLMHASREQLPTPTPTPTATKTPTPTPTATKTPTVVPQSCTSPKWTFLVFLNGDNNLDFWTYNLFNRLEMGADNSCVRILSLWDRSGMADTALYLVQPDHDPYKLATYTDGVNRWPRGELNMGDPQTLVNFVTQAKTDYPSPYTFLSLVDHGNGWAPALPPGPRNYVHTGMSFDDSSGGAYLSTSNLETVFGIISGNGQDPLDVVYYDACLMSMVENVYPLRNFVHFLVSSENESFSSYPYDEYLQSITGVTQPADLARVLVDRYHESLHGYPRTMAAFDLSYMQSVAQAVNGLAQALGSGLSGHVNELRASFVSAQKFDSNLDLRLSDTDAYIDLYHFAQLIKQNVSDASMRSAAQGVMDAIGERGTRVILQERHASGVYWDNGAYWDLDQARGLSIYLPLGQKDWLLDYYNGQELSWAADTAWDEFVRDLTDMVQAPSGPTPEPVDPAKRPGPLVSGNRQYLPLIVRP